MSSYKLFHDPDADCIFLQVEGSVTLETVRKVAPEVAALCAKTGCHNLLNDMSKATIELSIADLFESPAVMDNSKISQSIRRALVVPPSFADARFLENVTRRGHDFMVFSDIEKAKEWLLK